MTKNLKIFFITLLVSLPFWWGIDSAQKNLETFLYQKELTQNQRILAALAYDEQLKNELEAAKPIRNQKNAADLEIDARSALSVLVNKDGEERILFQNNIDKKLPIASLTKLMTARVVLKNYDLNQKITISPEAVQQEEDLGKLKVGDALSAGELLYPLLMESSNDAAFALAQDYPGMDVNRFVDLMNKEAENLHLSSTNFTNPSGLEPNYSTARDLAKFAEVLLEQNPSIWQILSTPQINIYGENLVNTDELLSYDGDSWWKDNIVGGKTGYTDESLGCLLLVVKAPKNRGYLINVILGTGDRFGQMEKLLNWLNKAYSW